MLDTSLDRELGQRFCLKFSRSQHVVTFVSHCHFTSVLRGEQGHIIISFYEWRRNNDLMETKEQNVAQKQEWVVMKRSLLKLNLCPTGHRYEDVGTQRQSDLLLEHMKKPLSSWTTYDEVASAELVSCFVLLSFLSCLAYIVPILYMLPVDFKVCIYLFED